MKVIFGIGKAKESYEKAVLTIGVFDGVHIGHQKLIGAAVESAKRRGGQSIVMTFDPHPVKVLRPEIYLPYIVSLQHRLDLIEKLGVDVCIVVGFTKRFANLEPDEFIQEYLVNRIQPEEIIVGEEFCFGKGRRGTIEYFKSAGQENGFVVNPMVPVQGEASKIGSTGIRKLISQGKLKIAAEYLGRLVSIFGFVTEGDGRGKTLGYPTANIKLMDGVLPPVGVYAVFIRVQDVSYPAMANIGRRPSFKTNDEDIHLEVHIFDFDQDIYGQNVCVEFVEKIRDEQEFASSELLIQRLKQDAKLSLNILNCS